MRIDSPAGRAVQKISASRVFAKVAPAIIPRLDRLVHRLTGGRRVLSKGLLPTVMLTTTGARSGAPRDVPLGCIPHEGALYVVGSNFGRERHPAWTGNLLKHPVARASFEGAAFEVRAHLLDADEKTAIWPSLTEHWPNFDVYTERSGRDLRVFRLERTDGAPITPARG